MKDVVYLKNGGIVRGIIIEQIPNESLKIQTQDMSVFVYRFDEIEKISKELGKEVKNRDKKPALAWFFSFLWPGVGQMYNNQVTKGVFMVVGGIILNIAAIVMWILYADSLEWVQDYSNPYDLGRYLDDEEYMIVAFCCHGANFLLWIWSQIDAAIQAKKINEGE